MPPVEQEAPEPKEAPASKPVIGIIYPPPEVRNIVDKTASFVARNGPEFETRIRQNELNNPKFNFLNQNDPYHAYYQHKVKEFKEGKAQEPAAPKATPSLALKPMIEPIKVIEPVVPKEPPPEFEFIADPPSISAFDLDVVKLTAQFVARNGRQFLTQLMNREQRNYQFDFLRPQHSLFQYFTKLVEQYTKVLIPPKDLVGKLRSQCSTQKAILDDVNYRVEWAKYQERERKKEEEAAEKERVAYAQIDWHDFVVVETVDFKHNEEGNFPPPTTPEEVGARLLAQERFEDGVEDKAEEPMEMEVESDDESDQEDGRMETGDKPAPPLPQHPSGKPPQPQDDTQVMDMEEDSDDEGDGMSVPPPHPAAPGLRDADKPPLPPPPPPPPSEAPQPPPLPPAPDQVIIRRDYNPKAPKMVQAETDPGQFMVSPITGEKIPAAKVPEHMRFGLLDPKWKDQRDRSIADRREQEEVYAAGSSIDSSLKQLAERRTDIFGAGDEETQIGKKIGEEEKKEYKVVWDGHTASMEKVSQKARENISIEEQIAVIHKAKGLLPDEEKEKIGPSVPKLPPHLREPPPQPPQPPVSKPPPPPPKPAGPPATSAAPAPPKPPPPHPPKSVPLPPPPLMQQRMVGRPPQMVVMGHQPPLAPPVRGPPVIALQGQPPMHMGMAPGPPPQGLMPPRGPLMPRPSHPPPPDDEPPAKKAKSEDSLIPEDDFLRMNQSPVTFRVAVPNMPEKAEWKLNGQMVTLTLPLTDTVSVIKAKLHEQLSMPAGKQKLQYEGLFIKDSNTLAYYNVNRGRVVSLQLKERGGRKK